jgi:hypothetical protein
MNTYNELQNMMKHIFQTMYQKKQYLKELYGEKEWKEKREREITQLLALDTRNLCSDYTCCKIEILPETIRILQKGPIKKMPIDPVELVRQECMFLHYMMLDILDFMKSVQVIPILSIFYPSNVYIQISPMDGTIMVYTNKRSMIPIV